MSPFSIIVETFRVTLKPLARIAVVMAFIMSLPDAGSATGRPPGVTGLRPASPAAALTPALTDVSAATPRACPQPVSTTTVALDLARLPASAFGDHDAAR